ncbi:phosphotransferase KptA/Tpt1 [Neocallimastix lanati (nom. inval.)]|jgi:2'-phosphotransferase|uniref:2'-phosphotransferase n=1 Tax=Neocallimastix californiae TaxID=1754190 RepID=A0A1Y2DZH4_9FUNG|nr:phosphotransferase KptA/Tpt1 [Neocallimastix sp. JGI-2020a]ORY64700.1 phosphotransferase KptA/Tpt1 [Neocallimastix californiae]|eukprot:ORY64700.1 phosphotransferase KptA/Tpt1 [Neocallimastix californiae]
MNYQVITGENKKINYVNVSKNISKLLRHTALKVGLQMDDEGYVKLDDILKLGRFKQVTFEDIQKIVETNDKKRYKMKFEDGSWYIKANQGHSIKLKNPNLKKVMDPSEIPVVIHGTYTKYLNSILDNGLIPKNRTHIHFAKGLYGEEGVISGMRYNYEIAIYIDSKKAMKDGIEFFISENGVILSTGLNNRIDKKYFKKICKKNGQEIPF